MEASANTSAQIMNARPASSRERFAAECGRLLTGEGKLPGTEDSSYAADMLFDILATIPDEKLRNESLQRSLDYVGKVSERIRYGVNPNRALSRDRETILNDLAATYHGKNFRHLELGTYDAFPDSRVAILKRECGIGEFIRLDLSSEYAPDVAADCTRLPFRDESIDFISSNSLFEHVAYPHRIIKESFRTLTPGGAMQVTMPFHFVQHFCPKDYMRLAPDFFEDMCREAGFAKVYCHVKDFGGIYYTLHNLAKAALIDGGVPPELRRVYEVLHHNVITMLALATTFDEGFQGGGAQLFTSVYCVAIKKGNFAARSPVASEGSMLDRLLPYLCCPATHQPLRHASPSRLVTQDGKLQYSVVNGIPHLFADPIPAVGIRSKIANRLRSLARRSKLIS
jgi:uncharacterized protein YbaR (Trm112 family)